MAKLKDGFYKQTAEAIGSDLYVLLAGGGMKPLADFANTSSVDYAAKAGDSDKLGGLPASSYLKIQSLSESTSKLLCDKVWSAGTTNKGDDSTQNECPTYYGMYLSLQYDTAKNQGYQFYGNTYTSTPTLYVRNRCAGNSHTSYNDWKQIAFISDIPTSLPASGGTADKANVLTTPRKIWGQYFDGSANVSGGVSSASYLEFDGVSSNAGHGGYIDFHFNGSSADYTSRIVEYSSGRLTINDVLHVNSGGNVLIGTTDDNGAKLQVNGSISCSVSSTNTPALYFAGGIGEYFDCNGNFVLPANAGSWNIFDRTNTNVLFRVNRTGTVLIGTTSDNGAKLQVHGNALIKETIIDAGYVTAHTPSTTGWYTVARVSGYFNFDIYISGGWNHGTPSIIRANICNINGTSYIIQLAGYAGGHCSAIRLGKISTDTYDVQVYIYAQSGSIGTQVCSFIGYGGLTTYATSTLSTTTYSDVNELAFKTLSGRYYTETEANNRFVNVSGDTMTGSLYFKDDKHYVQYYKDSSLSYLELYNQTGGCGIAMHDDGRVTHNKAGTHNILIHAGNISSYLPVVTSYYWADQLITSSAKSNTTPTFGSITISGGVDSGIALKTSGDYSRIRFYNSAGSNNATIHYFAAAHGGYSFVKDTLNLGGKVTLGAWNNPTVYITDNATTSDTSGKVGIGTTSPAHKLDVRGRIFSLTSDVDGVIIKRQTVGAGAFIRYLSDNQDSSGWRAGMRGTQQDFTFEYSSDTFGSTIQHMSLSKSGQLIIPKSGASSNSGLVVGGTSNAINAAVSDQQGMIQVVAGSGGATNSSAIGFHNPGISSAVLEYKNASADLGYFNFRSDDKTWNVGIGTTSPTQKLHVLGNAFIEGANITKYINYIHWGGRLTHGGGTYAWYNVYESTTNTEGDSIILNLSHSYWYTNTDSVTFAINTGYGNASITQLNSTSGSQIFNKIRVRWVDSKTIYVDVYIYSHTANTDAIYVSGSGLGTFKGPTATSDNSGVIKEVNIYYNGLYSPNAKFDSLIADPYIYFNTAKTKYCGYYSSGKYLELYNQAGGNGIWMYDGGNICLYTSNNVGIGTTSPTQKLHVNGAGIFTNTGSTTYASDGITIGAGDYAGRYITCYGKTSTSYINFGYSASTNNCGELYFSYSSSGSTSNYAALSLYSSANTIYVYPDYTKSAKYINAPGFVHPSYWSSAYALTSDGGAAHIGSMSVNYANSAGNADTLDGYHASSFALAHSHSYLPLSGGTVTGTIYLGNSTHYIQYYSSGKYVEMYNATGGCGISALDAGYVNVMGTGGIYASAFYQSSDQTLKTNIQSINNSDNIPELKSFDWKSDGTHSYGLIAQELEEQGYSELVSNEGDHKTVNYSAALSLIVGKLQVKIKELEKEIEILKTKNNYGLE